FRDVGLLAQILGDQFPGPVQGFRSVPVDAADDELGPVDVVQRAARFGGAFRQQVEGFLVVGGGDQVVEDDAIRDFPRQLHHFRAGGADVYGDVFRLPLAVDDVNG